jgi:hypothetical protein
VYISGKLCGARTPVLRLEALTEVGHPIATSAETTTTAAISSSIGVSAAASITVGAAATAAVAVTAMS